MAFNDNEQHGLIALKKSLYAQMNILLDTFPTTVSEHLRHNTILTGGAIASMMHMERPNDFDLYFKDDFSLSSFRQFIKNEIPVREYIKDVNEKYIEVVIEGKMVTGNAVTFKNGVQVILLQGCEGREYFDFIHCMPWYDISNNKLHISRRQYDAIKHKKLIVNPARMGTPTSKSRIEKYVKRGWVAN